MPTPSELKEEESTPLGLIEHLIDNYYNIHWDNLEAGDRIRSLFDKQIEMFKIRKGKDGRFNKKEAHDKLRRACMKGTTTIHEYFFKIINP